MSRRTQLFLLGALTGSALTYTYVSSRKHPPCPSPSSSPSTTSKQTQTTPHQPLVPERTSKLLQVGIPQSSQLQFRKNFITSVNYKTRVPDWVLEHLTKESLKGDADRQNVSFHPDESIPELFRARNEDYWKSGYSRGHLVPAGNNKQSQDAMKETFALSANIVPQDYEHNVWYWNRLELFVRDLTNYFDDVYVLTGPLWVPERIPGSEATNEPMISASAITSPSTTKKVLPSPPLEALPLPAGEDTIMTPVPPTIYHSDYNPAKTSSQQESQATSAVSVLPTPTPTSPPAEQTPQPVASPSKRPFIFTNKPQYQIRYPLIGTTHVAVPTHLFKAILAIKRGAASSSGDTTEEKGGNITATEQPFTKNNEDLYYFASFIIPNAPIPERTPLETFQVTKSALERVAGFQIFDRILLPNDEDMISLNLCKTHGCSSRMMTPDAHRLYFLTRDLRNAKRLERVERTVLKLREQGLVPDVEFMRVLDGKVEDLDGKEEI